MKKQLYILNDPKVKILIRPRGYETFFMLNSAKHENFSVNKYENANNSWGVVGWCEGAVYLTSLGRPTDIGLQLGKACYPCSG